MESQAVFTRPRTRKRRRRSKEIPLWPLGILVLGACVTGLVWLAMTRLARPNAARGLSGYIDNVAILHQEYARFLNQSLTSRPVQESFQYAAELVARGDYASASTVLETVAQRAPLPVVFNDLGALYARRGENTRAINAYRAAFGIDNDYQPARANLARLGGLLNTPPAVSQEMEPNDNYLLANVVTMNKPVEAEISAYNDVDCFRFRTPPSPRDVLAVEIEGESESLLPAISVFDENDRFLGWTSNARAPRTPLIQYFSLPPNSTVVLHIWGFEYSKGKYRFSLRPLRLFDRYEPNDDIVHAAPIPLRQTIEASIMDAADTDFYSFAASESGTAQIEIRTRSATLIPALTIYSSDHRANGSAPEVKTAGANISYTFPTKPTETYYVQVSGQAKTAGAYTLTVQ